MVLKLFISICMKLKREKLEIVNEIKSKKIVLKSKTELGNQVQGTQAAILKRLKAIRSIPKQGNCVTK